MKTSTSTSSQQCAFDSSISVRPAYDSDKESLEEASNDIQHENVAIINSLKKAFIHLMKLV